MVDELLFSGIVAVSTVVYAILTFWLVLETRRTRMLQTQPSVYAFIEARDVHHEIVDMFIQNSGLGPAYNLTFVAVSDIIFYKNQSNIYNLSEAGLVKNGLQYLAPSQKKLVFSTHPEKLFEWNGKDDFTLRIEYTDVAGKKFCTDFKIDFLTLSPVRMSLGESDLVDVMKKIKNDIHEMKKIKDDIHEINLKIKENEDIKQ